MSDSIPLDYSIIVPVYNAEFTLEELVNRLNLVMRNITSRFEIILINDNSADNSQRVMAKLEEQHRHVRGIYLTENSGRHHAIIIGCKQSQAHRAITMDDDLQHRPEDIPAMINKANLGFDAVFAEFKFQQHVGYKNLASVIKRRIETWAYSLPKDLFVSGFLLINRTLIEKFAAINNEDSYLPQILFTHTDMTKMTNAPATHDPRTHGISNYSAWRSIKFLANMMRNATSRAFKAALIAIVILSAGLIFAALKAIF